MTDQTSQIGLTAATRVAAHQPQRPQRSQRPAVQAAEHLALALVQPRELGVEPVVDRAVRRVRRERRRRRHQRRAPRPRARRRAPSPAISAAPRRLVCSGSATRSIGAVHDVGVDLAPQVGLRAAADHADRVEAAAGEAARPPRAASGCCRRRPRAPRARGRRGWSPARGCGSRRAPCGRRPATARRRATGVKSTPPAPGAPPRGQRGELVVAGVAPVVAERARRAATAGTAGGLLVVGDQVAVGGAGRGRWRSARKTSVFLNGTGQLIHDGGADRQVRLVVAHGAGAGGGGVQVGRAGDHLHAAREPELGGDVGAHRRRRPSRSARSGGSLSRVDAGQAHQGRRRRRARSRSRLSVSQAADHRRVRGGGDAGEAHRQVVDRLEVPARRARDVGLVAGEVEHVADRVVAARSTARRRCGGPSAPARTRRVAAHRAADDAPRVAARRACPSTSRSRRPGARPRRPARCWPTAPVQLTATTGSGATAPLARRAPGRVGDEPPPLLGVLHRAAAGQLARRDRPGGPARRSRPVSDTSPTFGPPVPRSTARTNRSYAARARSTVIASRSGGSGCWRVEHVGHHHLDELVGLVGQAAGDAAVDRAGARRSRPRARARRRRPRRGRSRTRRRRRAGSAGGSPPCGSRSGTAGR